MDLLIGKLFSPQQSPHVTKLAKSEDTRRLIIQEVGHKLLEDQSFMPSPIDQLLAIASLAHFADDDECQAVAGIIYRHINDLDVLPAVSVHHGKELAERCLIGLSLFAPAMEKRSYWRGAPPTDFYRRVGRQNFHIAGMESLSNHFIYWESFLSERLT